LDATAFCGENIHKNVVGGVVLQRFVGPGLTKRRAMMRQRWARRTLIVRLQRYRRKGAERRRLKLIVAIALAGERGVVGPFLGGLYSKSM
jgi:hypothetical protein